MDTMRRYILNKLFMFTACETDEELIDVIYELLVKEFPNRYNEKVIAPAKDDLHVISRTSQDKNAKYVFFAHADRLMFPERRMSYYVGDLEEEYGYPNLSPTYKSKPDSYYIKGQLDNIISVDILFYMLYIGYDIDIVFTTKEERLKSQYQMLRYMNKYDKNNEYLMISLDIDIAYSHIIEDLWRMIEGSISVSETSCGKKLYKPLIDKVRCHAKELNIPVNIFNENTPEQGGTYLRESPTNDKIIYLGMPLIEYHSPNETMTWATVENMVKFLESFLLSEGVDINEDTITG